MGGCVSVSMSCDQTLNQVSRSLSEKTNYIHKLKENVKTLEITMQELKDLRDDLLTRLFLEEEQGQRRLATVQRWLSNVETIESQVNDLLIATEKISRNFKSKFDYGERVFKKIKEVQVLKSRGDFRVMAQRVPILKVEERLIQPVVGLKTMAENVCNSLIKDEVGTLGLYGMGGVGKTTLLSQINNNFVDTDDFDVVIWVVVSKDPQIENIQETIFRRLGRCNEEWKHRKEDEKASEIKQILKSKRYMLLLDDIWSKVDIQQIGIPLPTRTNRCKVVFTTRSKAVCSEMQVDVEIEVKCLASDEAWELFRMRVGDITLKSHPEIPTVARVITQKCYGLPLALNVIGETMASRRTIQEWSHGLDVLTSFASEFSGMQDKILPILKFSYDNLNDDMLRKCLQYCALFPEDYEIDKEELVEYWICEGIIDGNKDRGRAMNHGYEIMGTLVRACLLMEYEHTEFLKMHDMVREMALWITTDLGRHKESFIVKAGVRLSHVPDVKDWSVVHKMSLMENQIERINTGPCGTTKLVTLFLQNNNLVNISEQFFKYMTELKVLDLSSNESLTQLPAEISKLVSLQYLNLSRTGIEMLPVGIKELRKLTHLDFKFTKPFLKLESLSLVFLDAVKSIYWSPLPFPALKRLKIFRCPTLMKIPLNSESAKGCDLVIDADRIWLQGIEWEDEATKNRFCPS